MSALVASHTFAAYTPVTNYCFMRNNTSERVANAAQLIHFARYYATFGLYIESWGTKDVARPLFTRKMPQNCEFLRYFYGGEAYTDRSYADLILCCNAEAYQRYPFAVNSLDEAVSILKTRPEEDFFLIRGTLIPAYQCFAQVSAETPELQALLIEKAVRFRAALPVVDCKIAVTDALVDRVAKACLMSRDDAFSWILACLGAISTAEMRVGVQVNPRAMMVTRIYEANKGEAKNRQCIFAGQNLKADQIEFSKQGYLVSQSFDNYAAFLPSKK